MKVRIGCSGYYYKEWKGIFYPQGLKAADWFSFYCQYFNTLELNTTFYRTPTQKSLQKWYNESPKDFLFAVKAPKLITHLKKFTVEKTAIDDFYTLIKTGLQEKLGCLLFQLPPSFQYSEERLSFILEKLDTNFKNVVEFRHISWWRQDVFNALGKNKITFCGQSYPGNIPDDVIKNTSIIYYRFHGKPVLYKSLYTKSALQDLVTQMGNDSQEAFIYFNNTWGTSALTNAKQMYRLFAA